MNMCTCMCLCLSVLIIGYRLNVRSWFFGVVLEKETLLTLLQSTQMGTWYQLGKQLTYSITTWSS